MFSKVSAVRRLADPLSRREKISLALVTISSSRPLTRTPPFPSSIRGNCFFCFSSKETLEISSGASKSVISSLYSSKNVTFTLYSAFWPSRVSKICWTALGITPASEGKSPFGPLCHNVTWHQHSHFMIYAWRDTRTLTCTQWWNTLILYLWPLGFTFHRVSFPCTSLTICKYGTVEAF